MMIQVRVAMVVDGSISTSSDCTSTLAIAVDWFKTDAAPSNEECAHRCQSPQYGDFVSGGAMGSGGRQ